MSVLWLEILNKGKKSYFMAGARNYSQSTIKRLFAFSGNQCAFPGCDKKLVSDEHARNSNICHIEAASEGGERYNSDLTNQQRADYPNLILLCPDHHHETNDVNKYTVEGLKGMKADHEARIREKMNSHTNPSILTTVINIISDTDIEEFQESEIESAFNAMDKIEHNCVSRNKSIIEEYRVYQGKLQTLFTEIEKLGSVKKDNLLRNIKQFYLNAKNEILLEDQSIENVRKHADDLIEAVEGKMFNIIDNSSNKLETLDIESISLGVKIVLVDAFLRCKILEEVPHD